MIWIPIGAWLGAAVVALLVLGYCGYQIIWRSRRLQRDLAQLQELNAELQRVQQALAATQERLAASGLG